VRVLLIALCRSYKDVRPAALSSEMQSISHVLMRQGVEVSGIALIPWWMSKRCLSADLNTEHGLSTDSRITLDLHAIRLPGLARSDATAAQQTHLWPGAGFAFPFIGNALVDFVHAKKPDIFMATDLEISGHIAWRLHEITGVPYVVMATNLAKVVRRAGKPAIGKRLQDIGMGAQCVLHGNEVDIAAIATRLPGMRLHPLSKHDAADTTSTALNAPAPCTGEPLVAILQTAIRRATEPFDW
jgi:hypothetical protein